MKYIGKKGVGNDLFSVACFQNKNSNNIITFGVDF